MGCLSCTLRMLRTITKPYTRGNGVIGRDISWICNHVKFGTVHLGEYVRGELIISTQKWNEVKNRYKEFSNARNFVSGITNRKRVDKTLLSYLDFIAFEYISLSSCCTFSDQFALLERRGFNVVFNDAIQKKDINESHLSLLLQTRSQVCKYEIDGIILSSNSVHKRVKSDKTYPSYSKAFKKNVMFVETQVVGVSWNPSMYGILKPLVHIKKVVIDNVNVQNVTGHNARYIEEHKIGKGSVVRITRSGGVIPKITHVIQGCARPSMPSRANMNWVWNDTHVDIILKDPLSNEIVQMKRIEHLLIKLNIKCIKAGKNVKKLYTHGVRTIKDLFLLSETKLNDMKIPGIGQKIIAHNRSRNTTDTEEDDNS